MLVNEIRQIFAQTKNNTATRISTIYEYDAWVVRKYPWIGVAIENTKNISISEKFTSVKIFDSILEINDVSMNLLILTTDNEILRNEFASVCAEFCDPGKIGEKRVEIVNNPFSWWEKWRDLLGNTIQDKSPYSLLGEMIVFDILLEKDRDVVWNVISRSTHDVVSVDTSYEVKSTIKRYESSITINSQYQLKLKTSNDLWLIFCRFEPSVQGISINDMVSRLTNKGINAEKLENGLGTLDYEKGKNSRNNKYILLEVRKYLVDSDFPMITSNSFKDDKIPKSVIKISYEVDLSGIPFEIIEVETYQ